MIKILIVDDEKPICDLIDINLSAAGYHCSSVQDGLAAIDLIEKEDFDLVLLDIMLPGADGFDIMEYIRPMKIPVIFITARVLEEDMLNGYSLGADDYVAKPFQTAELMARVRSQLRRYMTLGDVKRQEHADSILKTGGLSLDLNGKELYVDGERVRLTATEYKITEFLMRNMGQVFSAEEIYAKVWNEDAYAVENTVMVHIRRIREKIEINTKNPKYLKVVWGIGYRMEKI